MGDANPFIHPHVRGMEDSFKNLVLRRAWRFTYWLLWFMLIVTMTTLAFFPKSIEQILITNLVACAFFFVGYIAAVALSQRIFPALSLCTNPPLDAAFDIERFRHVRDQRFDCELRFNQTIINHDGTVALCCSVYSQPNQLGVQFLDHPRAELEAMRYRNEFCNTCYRYGLQYAPKTVHDLAASNSA